MSSLKYWIWLSTLPEMPPVTANKLIQQFGAPEEVFFAPDNAFDGLPDELRKLILKRDLGEAERVLERCDTLYITPVTMQDALYPERLRNIPKPPLVLYIKGRLPVMDEEAALAVVGTRDATPYGLNNARKLCYSLAKSGMLIVSGMAKGIDAAANRAALDAGASTIAVLGCGPDVIYPFENKELYRDICASGAVVSEYPPGTQVKGHHFPARNRIISGLSLGTLVIEGPRGSGALITANYALEQGRDVFAVPGCIDVANSSGPNGLIREGAVLVTRPEHILEEYMALYPHKIRNGAAQSAPPEPVRTTVRATPPRQSRENKPEQPARPAIDLTAALADFSPLRQRILLYCAGAPKHIDNIAANSGEDAADVVAELTMLEIEGLVTVLPGKRFALNLEALV